MSKNFKNTLRDVYNACRSVFYINPTNEDVLKAATQIYIEERKLEEARKEKDDEN